MKGIDSHPDFDLATIQKLEVLSNGPDDDFVGELITEFIEKTPAKIKNLETAISRKDSDFAFKLSHSLKTVSGTLGLRTFADCCSVIEKFSFDNNMDQAMNEFAYLTPHFETGRQRLTEFLQRGR